MTVETVCDWCDTKLNVKDHYDPLQHPVFCSKGCMDADKLFRLHFGDEEMNRRAHYQSVMRGLSDGQGEN